MFINNVKLSFFLRLGNYNKVNDKINNEQITEFNNIGKNGWELFQILPRSKEDKFHVDLAIWKRKK